MHRTKLSLDRARRQATQSMSQSRREDTDFTTQQLWYEALWRFARAPKLTDQRQRQIDVICAIKGYLDPIVSQEQLLAHYQANAELCRHIALALHPGDGQLQDLHRTQDVAYALRYVELMTGHELHPRDRLPSWIGEWAVF